MEEPFDADTVRLVLKNAAGMLREEDGGFMPPRLMAAEHIDLLLERFFKERKYRDLPLTLEHAESIAHTAWCFVRGSDQPSIPAGTAWGDDLPVIDDYEPNDEPFPDLFDGDFYPKYSDLPELLFRLECWLTQMSGQFGKRFLLNAFKDVVP
jgi:hypothetical protein